MKPLKFSLLNSKHWDDFEELFGNRGACGGCWCMLWRLTRSEFEEQKGEANKRALKRLVDEGETPGILAYRDRRPVGWCAVAPRTSYPALDRSRVLKRIDDHPVWSITCFFVAKPYRRQGVSVQLLKAAIEYVRKSGGRIVEGYPVEPKKDEMPDVFAYQGFPLHFSKPVLLNACAVRSQTYHAIPNWLRVVQQ